MCHGECGHKLFQWTMTPVQLKGKIILYLWSVWHTVSIEKGNKNIWCKKHFRALFFFYFLLLCVKVKTEIKSRCWDLYLLFLYYSQHKNWNIGQFLLERSCQFVIKRYNVEQKCSLYQKGWAEYLSDNLLYVTSHCESYHISHLFFWRQSSHV